MKRYWILLLVCFYSCGDKINKNKVFSLMPSSHTGIDFENTLRETETFNSLKYGYYYNGGGVAVGDINNDSLPDIYFTANMKASHLYLNQGNWKFKEIAKEAGVRAAGLWNTGTAMADVNGDGYLDIYVCRSAANIADRRKNRLYINNGDLTFTEKSQEYGLADPGYSTQASFFDYDRDGDLDMYLLNHSVQKYAGFEKNTYRLKERTNPYYGDKLYRNDGDKFTDVTKEAGIHTNVLGFGLGVTVTDVNADGWYDIYIANDYNEEDYLYINQGDGTFKDSLRAYMRHISHNSMGSDGADMNNDLRTDIYTLDMLPEENFQLKTFIGPENYDKYQLMVNTGFYNQTMRNMLQLNNGNQSFSEIGQLAGVSNTHWSWSALFADFNLDGWKDLFVSNGFRRNYLDMDFMNYAQTQSQKYKPGGEGEGNLLDIIEEMPTIDIENYIYENNKDLTFSKRSEEWGITENTLSNGAAYGDLDNDGDLDLVVNNINEEAHIYQNNSNTLNQNHYLKVALRGTGGNKFGVGGKVYLFSGELQQLQEMIPVRGFQSSISHSLHFGLGNKQSIDSLIVEWPDGTFQKLEGVAPDQTLTLHQKNAKEGEGFQFKRTKSHFGKVRGNAGIDFVHKENEYIDFKADPMLPAGISNTGGRMATGDIYGNGLKDIYFGGAKGQAGIIYKQISKGQFSKSGSPVFNEDKQAEDMDAALFDADGDGDKDLYVVSGGSDFEKNAPVFQDRLYINNGNGNFTKKTGALPEMNVSGASVTAGDIDGDGDMDLFVGGRLIPGSYPMAPESYLLANDGNGNFSDVTEQYAPALRKPGMVTDAKFLHLNDDELLELVVVGEWMPVQIYINEGGNSYKLAQNESLKDSGGWWNKIHADDFDNDGDNDLVLGNFGLNNQYKPSPQEPASIVYKDFDNNDEVDPLLFHYRNGEKVFAYSRDVLLNEIPPLETKFPDYESFAKSSPDAYFSKGESVNADTLAAPLFETIYMENQGKGEFSIKKLPVEAQFAPVYTIESVDINGDGHLDIITGGNQTKSRVSTGSYDANYGVILTGNGNGKFSHLDSQKSGLNIRGDVRDMEIINAGDQKLLVISGSDMPVKVYRINSDEGSIVIK